MSWLNARPTGDEVARVNEEYTVGEYETGLVLPRGLALEDSPSASSADYWDGDSWEPLTEVSVTPGATEFRVLYDPAQPLGGAWEFGAIDTTPVRISYSDRGSLVWAHDQEGFLSDVTLTTETSGDLLQYDGAGWVNVAVSTLSIAASQLTGTVASARLTGAYTGITGLGTLAANLLFTDATYDIGKSGATRPRDLFLSRNATVGGTLGVGSTLSVTSTATLAGTTISSTIVTLNAAVVQRSIDTSAVTISGGSASNSGANMQLYGTTHSTLAGVWLVRDSATERLRMESGILRVGTTSAGYATSGGGRFAGLVQLDSALYVAGKGIVGAASAPFGAAAFEVRSTTGFLLLPRMTTTERDAISNPQNGSILYNSTTSKIQGRAGSSWVDLHA